MSRCFDNRHGIVVSLDLCWLGPGQASQRWSLVLHTIELFLKEDFVHLFLEGKGGRKRKRNINVWLSRALLGTWPATQACALTGNQTSDPLVCRLVLNPLSHTSRGRVEKL